jgi:hypothetical protein
VLGQRRERRALSRLEGLARAVDDPYLAATATAAMVAIAGVHESADLLAELAEHPRAPGPPRGPRVARPRMKLCQTQRPYQSLHIGVYRTSHLRIDRAVPPESFGLNVASIRPVNGQLATYNCTHIGSMGFKVEVVRELQNALPQRCYLGQHIFVLERSHIVHNFIHSSLWTILQVHLYVSNVFLDLGQRGRYHPCVVIFQTYHLSPPRMCRSFRSHSTFGCLNVWHIGLLAGEPTNRCARAASFGFP